MWLRTCSTPHATDCQFPSSVLVMEQGVLMNILTQPDVRMTADKLTKITLHSLENRNSHNVIPNPFLIQAHYFQVKWLSFDGITKSQLA